MNDRKKKIDYRFWISMASMILVVFLIYQYGGLFNPFFSFAIVIFLFILLFIMYDRTKQKKY